jgi:hypothetical protein
VPTTNGHDVQHAITGNTDLQIDHKATQKLGFPVHPRKKTTQREKVETEEEK